MPEYGMNQDYKKQLHMLVDPLFHAGGNPHSLWKWMREVCPIYWHESGEYPGFWSVTRHKFIKEVYGNPTVFSSEKGVLLRPKEYGDDVGGGLTLALTDPPRHKKLKSIMTDWFSLKYAKTLEGAIERKIAGLLESASRKDVCDFTHDISSPLTLFVTCHVMGIPPKMHNSILQWSHESFSEGKPLAANKNFMIYFCGLMEEKKMSPSDDLASAIVHGLADDKKLAEEEIILNFENLIGATENAGLSISSGILAFLNNPKSLDALRLNEKLLPTAVEEVLRWASSATHSMRTVKQDFYLEGISFKKGQKVVLWLPSGNRDEEVFPDPYKFDISRLPNPHLALGFGEHFCIGNALGRLQMKMLLKQIIAHNWAISLASVPKRLQSIHVNGPINLPVKINKS